MSDLKTAVIKNNRGGPMLTANKIHLKDDQIVMDGNVLGTMPGQFFISPLDLYKMYIMIDKSLIFKILGILRKGKKEYKSLETQKDVG